MKVAFYPKRIDTKDSVLVLGAFSSIHNGHKKLIEKATQIMKNVSVMIIEDETTMPNKAPRKYESLDIRLEQLSILGVSKVSIVKFDSDTRLLSGKEFVKNIVKATKAKHLVMGEDFACGMNRDYKAKDIANDYETTIVKHEKINGIKLSTGIIREMALSGEMDVIKKLSPFPYQVETRVSSNGYYNIDTLRPQPGIYIVSAIVDEIQYWALSSSPAFTIVTL